MSSFFDRLRRKSHESSRPEDSGISSSGQLEHRPAAISSDKSITDETFQPPAGPPPGYSHPSPRLTAINDQCMPLYPNSGDPGCAAHQNRQVGSNMGMAAGAMMGAQTGDPITGMVEGQIAGGMIAQQINQRQQHQYWREQAIKYRNEIPPNGSQTQGGSLLTMPGMEVGAGPQDGLLPTMPGDAGNAPSGRSVRRDEKRKKRWDRRAARQDRKKVDGSLESDEDVVR